MMRRGPLDRYPPEWVLRQAGAHGASGSLEFHTERPITLHLDDGRIYAGAWGIGAADPSGAADEGSARRAVVELLTELVDHRDGWYYLDPLGEGPGRGAWSWETASLLMDTRVRAHEERTLASWSGRRIELRPTEAAGVALGADSWAVVVALTSATSTEDLAAGLGWTPDRLVAALAEIEQRGVLDPGPVRRSDPGGGPGAAAAPKPTGRHQGPLAPPPPLSAAALISAGDGPAAERSRLRRRRGERRSAP